jgi:diacylglycerol kinase family enzyme
MKPLVLINAAAGPECVSRAEADAGRVRDAFRARDVKADVRLVPPRNLYSIAREASRSDAEVVAAGGGDGTISTVAAALVGRPKPLGIVPLGTLNHLARDLKIPLTIDGAVETIVSGTVRSIDVGDVNGQTFVNNSSLGIYPRMVIERDAQRAERGVGKWPAMGAAFLKTLRRFPTLTVSIETPEGELSRKTPLVFVGNNRYELDLLSVGSRAALDEGVLSLYIANTSSRLGILRLGARAITGSLRQDRDFEARYVPACEVDSRRRRLHVAIDGEVIVLEPPLEYRVRPRALRVIVPTLPGDAA